MTLEASAFGVKGQIMRPEQIYIKLDERFKPRPELAAHLMTLMADVVSAPMVNVRLKMPRSEMVRERLEFSVDLAENVGEPAAELIVSKVRQRFHNDTQLHIAKDSDILQAFWLAMFEDARSRGDKSSVNAEMLRGRLSDDYLAYANRRYPVKQAAANV